MSTQIEIESYVTEIDLAYCLGLIDELRERLSDAEAAENVRLHQNRQ